MGHTRGQKGGQKGSKVAHFPTNGDREPENLVRYVIQHGRFAGNVHFCHIRIGPFLGHHKGQKGGQKGSKVAHFPTNGILL